MYHEKYEPKLNVVSAKSSLVNFLDMNLFNKSSKVKVNTRPSCEIVTKLKKLNPSNDQRLYNSKKNPDDSRGGTPVSEIFRANTLLKMFEAESMNVKLFLLSNM